MLGADMPEATVYEHGHLRSGERDIDGPTGHAGNRQGHTEPQTHGVEKLAYCHLGLRVTPTLPAHPPRYGNRTRCR